MLGSRHRAERGVKLRRAFEVQASAVHRVHERARHSVDVQQLAGMLQSRGTPTRAAPTLCYGIVDRIGAGDAFAAGVLHGLICGFDPQKTIDFATAAALPEALDSRAISTGERRRRRAAAVGTADRRAPLTTDRAASTAVDAAWRIDSRPFAGRSGMRIRLSGGGHMYDFRKFYHRRRVGQPRRDAASSTVINPATEQPVGKILLGTAEDVDAAVKAARAAFETFSQTSREERVALLERIIKVYKARMKDVARRDLRRDGRADEVRAERAGRQRPRSFHVDARPR